MSAFLRSRKDLAESAVGLLALFRGEEGEAAEVGALVVADAVNCLQIVRTFLTKSSKG